MELKASAYTGFDWQNRSHRLRLLRRLLLGGLALSVSAVPVLGCLDGEGVNFYTDSAEADAVGLAQFSGGSPTEDAALPILSETESDVAIAVGEVCGPEQVSDFESASVAVFEQYCVGCHNPEGSGAGAIENILDVEALLADGKLVAGQPERSPILIRMRSTDLPMPPAAVEARPTAEDIAAIEAWVNCLGTSGEGIWGEEGGGEEQIENESLDPRVEPIDDGVDPIADDEVPDIEWPDSLDFAECSPDDQTSLSTWAGLVFETNCVACHTPGGVQSKITDILDLNDLIDVGVVVPGDPWNSPVFKRMDNEEMPPPESSGPFPDAVQASLVEQWISCLKTEEPDVIIDHEQLYNWIETDLEQFQEFQLVSIRYVTLTHLHNAGATEQELESYRQAVSKVMNSLSWEPAIMPVEVLEESEGLVLRLELDAYSWDEFPLALGNHEGEELWKLIEEVFPYSYRYNAFSEELIEKTGSIAPVVPADWFVATATRPPLYHELLGLPETSEELEEGLGIDVVADLAVQAKGYVVAGGFATSKVSLNNRIIMRHDLDNGDGGVVGKYDGGFWVSYDFNDSNGKQDIFDFPLNFVHAGNEIIFNLPNGFQAYMITNAEGVRLDEAPIDIVQDSFSQSGVVENGLSCMGCHFNGMNDGHDEIGFYVGQNPSNYDSGSVGLIQNLYDDILLQSAIASDRERFLDAITLAGVDTSELPSEEPIRALSDRHISDMKQLDVAAAMGTNWEALTANEGFDKLTQAQPTISSLATSPANAIRRTAFDEAFPDLLCWLELGEPLSRESGEFGCAFLRLCNVKNGLDADAELVVSGTTFVAKKNACSPCRAVPVGDAIAGHLTLTQTTVVPDGKGGFVDSEQLVLDEGLSLEIVADEQFILPLQGDLANPVIQLEELPVGEECQDFIP